MALELLPLPAVDQSDPLSVRKNQRAAELNFKRIVTWSEAGVLNGAGTASRLSYWTDADTLAAVSDLTSFIAGSGAVSVVNDGDGTVTISVSSTVLTDAVILAPASSARNVVQPTGAAVIPMILKGATSQSANLLEFQNSSGTVLAYFEADGELVVSRAQSSGNVVCTIQNTSGVSAGARLVLSINSASGSSGDAAILFENSGAFMPDWIIGPDSSNAEAPFCINAGTSIDANAPDTTLVMSVHGTTRETTFWRDLYVARVSTSAVALFVSNSSATSAAHAKLNLVVSGTSGGDPLVSYSIPSGTSWAHGPDNSDSDAFVVSESSTLGTNNNLKIAVGGATSILRGDLDVTRAQASGAVGLTIENTSATGATASLYLKTTGADHAQQIQFSGNGSANWAIVRDGRFTNDMLAFHDQSGSANAILTLDGTAGVGVGLGTNSAPSEKLHVYHASNSALSILVQNAGNGSAAHSYLNLMSSHSSADNAIRFSSGTPASYDVDWMIGEDASDSNAIVFSYVNTFGGGSLGTNNRLRITTAGDVQFYKDIVLPTVTGTKLGTSTSQLLGFWNKTPVAQPSHIADPSGGATQDTEARTAIGAILDLLEGIGLMAV